MWKKYNICEMIHGSIELVLWSSRVDDLMRVVILCRVALTSEVFV